MKRAALVYQCGIANVFDTSGPHDMPELASFGKDPTRGRTRLLQHAFEPCYYFALGLLAAGVVVETYHCAEAGDVAGKDWSSNLDGAPFADQLRRVGSPTGRPSI